MTADVREEAYMRGAARGYAQGTDYAVVRLRRLLGGRAPWFLDPDTASLVDAWERDVWTRALKVRDRVDDRLAEGGGPW